MITKITNAFLLTTYVFGLLAAAGLFCLVAIGPLASTGNAWWALWTIFVFSFVGALLYQD